MTPHDEPCVVPVRDSWRYWSGAASWLWSPHTRPGSNNAPALNRWSAGQLAATLGTLRPIARVRTASFNTPPGVVVELPERTWCEPEPHEAFERALIAFVEAAPLPITTIDLALDLHAWVRTAPAPAAPVRGWIARSLEATLTCEVESPFGSLTLDSTLFFAEGLHGDSNLELHRLNAPLLRDVLAAIEIRLGAIDEVSGLPGVTRAGISTPE